MADEATTTTTGAGDTNPGTTGAEGAGAAAESQQTTTATPEAWLSDDLKGNEAFKDFKSANDLAKAHLDMIEKSKPPEAYALQIPEGMKVNDNFVSAAKGWAKDSGLTQAQFEKFAGHYMANQGAVEKAIADAQARDVATLKTEWGGEYDAKMEVALKAARTFVGEDFAAAMQKDPVLKMVKAFYNVGTKITDDTFNPPGESGQASADSKLKKLYPSMYK